jgi:DNA polymerase I
VSRGNQRVRSQDFVDGETIARSRRVVQGIVDSIWVTPDSNVNNDDRKDLETLATAITERVEIRIEHEAHYDWVASVPQRESNGARRRGASGNLLAKTNSTSGHRIPAALYPAVHQGYQADIPERFNAT